ncbi:MAG TPA: T9SS type A sorting domain-containing protein [Candidatus Binatia bacterium]|nr:T9SS type A sorting domain-containing protein [Candidatus Binatia bacterium]
MKPAQRDSVRSHPHLLRVPFLLSVLTLLGATIGAEASPLRDRDVSLRRQDWFWSGVPVGKSGLVADHARIEWYLPRVPVVERDLNPALSNEQGGSDAHPALELSIRPPTGEALIDSSDWTGIVQQLDLVGLDLSGLQAVEIWVNDFHAQHTSTKAILRVALGRFSEDAFWDPKNPPNFDLDTEDKNQDGRLDRFDPSSPDYLVFDEDTGLDGLHDAEEPGYAGLGSDPNGDDYRYNPQSAPDDHSRINGTEGNGIHGTDARPDTEDLNRDGGLDLDEDYHEVGIDLADTAFVLVDVPRDDRDNPSIDSSNGWRQFRIPLEAFGVQGRPNWPYVPAIRLAIEGMADTLRLQIGGIRFVGVPAPPVAPRIVLRQNRPNPFNPSTTIEYELSREERVRLEVFDVTGRRVATLVDRVQGDGLHRAFWSGRDDRGRPVPSGVYVYRLRTDAGEASHRMVLVK